MDWEGMFSRFDHIGQQIFGLLDNNDLARCREASRGWKDFIDYEEIAFKRILKTSFDFLDPLLTAAWFGQTSIYEKRSKNLENPNPDWGGITALHWAAQRVHSTLVNPDLRHHTRPIHTSFLPSKWNLHQKIQFFA